MNKFDQKALDKITDKVLKFKHALTPKSKKRVCNKLKVLEKSKRSNVDDP